MLILDIDFDVQITVSVEHLVFVCTDVRIPVIGDIYNEYIQQHFVNLIPIHCLVFVRVKIYVEVTHSIAICKSI